MIDTIQIRIHGTTKYRYIIERLKSFAEGATKYVSATLETDTYTGKKMVFNHGQKAAILYNDSGTVIPLSYRRSVSVGSHSYGITYMVNYDKDFLDFEFSIPKYLKGHNIYQFINYHDPKNTLSLYVQLINFIRDKFIHFISPTQMVDFKDIQINRIDLCFNQFHISKRAAMETLDQLKKMQGATLRSAKGKIVYRDSFMIKTENYTLKVYHKGAEFAAHDAKKLKQVQHKGIFEIKDLQEAADNILRYEISYRNGMFNYLFQQIYRIRKAKPKNAIYRKLWKALNIEDKESDNYLQKQFRLETVYDNPNKVRERIPLQAERIKLYRQEKFAVTFTHEIFEEVFNHFWRKLNAFQIDTSMSKMNAEKIFYDWADRETKRSKLLGKKFTPMNLRNFMYYFDMSQLAPINSYVPEKFSKASLARIRKLFRAMNLKDYNPDVQLYRTNFDYQDYKMRFGKLHS